MITIDEDKGVVSVVIEATGEKKSYPMSSAEAFHIVSKAWLRAGWDTKYVYSFSWMGRPVIQLPDDMIRIQEVIYRVKPDVVIETGVAHGGSLVFYASMFKAMGKGRVIGIDIEIRPHNRKAIEAHELYPYITLIEGSSIDSEVLERVRGLIKADEKVLVILDSNHQRDHVLSELEGYGPMVTEGSYIVATDGIMAQVAGAPRSAPDWSWNNPIEAKKLFLEKHSEFVEEEPAFPFNESMVNERVTYWPQAFLKRKTIA